MDYDDTSSRPRHSDGRTAHRPDASEFHIPGDLVVNGGRQQPDADLSSQNANLHSSPTRTTPPAGPLEDNISHSSYARANHSYSSSRRWSLSSSSTLVSDQPTEYGSGLMAAGTHAHQSEAQSNTAPSDAASAYPKSSYRPRPPPLQRPLIDFATNEWQQHPKYAHDLYASHSPDDSFFFEREEWDFQYMRMFLARRIPRRVQRYLVIYLSLFGFIWLSWKWVVRPSWQLRVAIDAAIDKGGYQTFGSNMMPSFSDMIQLKELDSSHLPTTRSNKQRLVIVGDVHGCKDELVHLLDKISFRSTDHLVLTGDIIAKGPDSPGVVDLVRDISASCVRGNHEDRMLLAWAEMQKHHSVSSSEDDNENNVDITMGSKKERKLATQFSKTQIRWLQQCPVILKVGQIAGMGDVTVVHAGLVPGVPLQKQDPYQTMNMRTIDLETKLPSEERIGVPWEKLWNRWQKRVSPNDRGTVIYGHDSKRGLNIQKFSKGLDSGCVNGGKLTAMIIEAGKKKGDPAVQTLASVKCKNYKTNKSYE